MNFGFTEDQLMIQQMAKDFEKKLRQQSKMIPE